MNLEVRREVEARAFWLGEPLDLIKYLRKCNKQSNHI